jgi:hypothetical protein
MVTTPKLEVDDARASIAHNPPKKISTAKLSHGVKSFPHCTGYLTIMLKK